MTDRKSTKPAKRKPVDDENVIARHIVEQATRDKPQDESTDDEPTDEERSAAARMLGRRGGLKGGPARARKLSKKRRREIAKTAAEARWGVKNR